MSDEKPFLWAQGEQANVKEPIQALKDHGWRHGDVPTASNFNWVLNRIAKDADALNKDFVAFKSTTSQELIRLPQRDERLRTFALALKADLEMVLRESDRLANNLEVMCVNLQVMEQQIKAFHSTYQPRTWPEIVRRPPRRERNDPFDNVDRHESLVENTTPSLPDS